MELGEASIKIELKNGTISVLHGTDGNVLAELKDAPAGTWDAVWEALEKLGLKNQYGLKSLHLARALAAGH